MANMASTSTSYGPTSSDCFFLDYTRESLYEEMIRRAGEKKRTKEEMRTIIQYYVPKMIDRTGSLTYSESSRILHAMLEIQEEKFTPKSE
jgi:hypothetical protein